MINLLLIAGARPNFMKVAPLMKELSKHALQARAQIVHTGQHYDADMSDVFFADLGLGRPDRFLGVGSGSHAQQTAKVMIEFEQVCLQERPDLVVVVGDVNSTMACAITAKKLCIPVAHVEAGLRSRDWSMPEEINRIVTDAISDFLFTSSRDADLNLLGEGIPRERIHFVGNVMIDTLLALLTKAEGRETLDRFQVKEGNYATLTLHRPSNVDDRETLSGIVDVLIELSAELTIVWPIHPRSKKNLEKFDLWPRLEQCKTIKLSPPLSYLDMLALNRKARLILTDSGGLQEEATILRVPCVTLRDNTERPVTVEAGCNRLAGNRPCRIRAAVGAALTQNGHEIRIPEGWDGRAAERAVNVILSHYSK